MMPPEQLLVAELLLTAIDLVSVSIAYGTDVIKPEGYEQTDEVGRVFCCFQVNGVGFMHYEE